MLSKTMLSMLFIRKQEAKGLLDSLRLNTPLNRLKNAFS